MKRTVVFVLATLIILVSAIAFAQSSGGEFEIVKSTIDNGGGTSFNSEFSLTGTIGQPDANHRLSTGGGFALAGGFWSNAAVIELMFKDSFESD